MGVTSNFFNLYNYQNEQNLLDGMNQESIKLFGIDAYYIPRSLVNYNPLYGEDTISEYTEAYALALYVKNIFALGGQGDFLSKFNLQIRDTITFRCSRSEFEADIGLHIGRFRPLEGDLIFFPMNKKVFVINFVEHEAQFYQLGKLYTYDLQCQLWEYSNEIMNTGIPEIDKLQTDYNFAMNNYSLLTEDQFVLSDEYDYPFVLEEYDSHFQPDVGNTLTDHDYIKSQSKTIIDFNETNPFGDIK